MRLSMHKQFVLLINSIYTHANFLIKTISTVLITYIKDFQGAMISLLVIHVNVCEVVATDPLTVATLGCMCTNETSAKIGWNRKLALKFNPEN